MTAKTFITTRKWLIALLFAGAVGCSGRSCTGCTHVETCEECVQRCVETQGVSPEVCRLAACSNICPR
jgi:hypothetical protein